MRRIKYFVLCNLSFVIIALISLIIFPKYLTHIGITLTFLVGEPLTLFYMYKLKKD